MILFLLPVILNDPLLLIIIQYIYHDSQPTTLSLFLVD